MGKVLKRIVIIVIFFILIAPMETVMAAEDTSVYDTVKAMKTDAANLKAGDLVRTKGYYTAGDNGGALYNIVTCGSREVNERNVISLDNNLLAVLKVENNTVNVKQYGARGDGSADDHKAIELAVTSGAANIQFEPGEYKCTDELYFYRISDITIEGNGAIIFTDDDYRKELSWKEHFISVVGTNQEKAQNIVIRNLAVETRGLYKQEVGQKYKNQIVFQYVDQVLVEGCTFYISEKFVPDLEEDAIPDATKKLEYSCFDLYTGWQNVIVRDCRFINEAGAFYGVCAQFRDIWNAGGQNVEFYNNQCYSNSKDEIIAVFSGESSGSFIKDVIIRNNDIIADQTPYYDRDICMTVGYDNSNCCDNIRIYSNKITGVCNWTFFGMGKTLTDSYIRDNEIICKTSNVEMKAAIVRSEAADSREYNNVFSGNTITISAYKGNGLQSVFAGNGYFTGNKIISEEKVYAVFMGNGHYENNEIQVNSGVSFIGKAAKDIKNNKIQIKGNLSAGFEFYNTVLKEKVEIKGNTIGIEGTGAGTMLMLNGTTINGHPLIFCDNIIEAPNCFNKATLVYFQLKDEIPQTIYLADNDLGPYEGIIQMGGAEGVTHFISDEIPKEEASDEMPKEDSSDKDGEQTNDKTEESGYVSSKEENVVDDTEIKALSIRGISHKIAAGKKINLSLKILPQNVGNKTIVWKSGNKKYAVVNRSGRVTTKKAGRGKIVIITAEAKDGSGKKASYKIKIMKNAVTGIKIEDAPQTLKAGKSIKLAAKVKTNGKNANKTLKWSTSNAKYATVNANGKVKAKKTGKNKTVTITASSTDGTNKKAKVKIKIK